MNSFLPSSGTSCVVAVLLSVLLLLGSASGAPCDVDVCEECVSKPFATCAWSPRTASCHEQTFSDGPTALLQFDSLAQCHISEIWHAIRPKLLSLTEEEVDNAITAAADHIPALRVVSRSRFIASLLVAHASRWAGRRAMSTLANSIRNTKEMFLSDGRSGMLSDVLRYFLIKKVVEEGDTGTYMDKSSLTANTYVASGIKWSDLSDGSNILVDSLFLALLETKHQVADNPLTTSAAREHIASRLQDGKLRLLIPLGWVSGVTIFNQRRLGAVAAALTTRFARYMEAHEVAADDVTGGIIDDFLMDHVLQRLAAALQIPVEDVEKQVVWLEAPVPPADALVAHYAQHMPSLRDFVRVLEGWAGGRDWTKIFQLLRDHAAVYSFNRLASLAETLAEKLKVKIGTLTDKSFIIPYKQKSFSVVNLIFFMNTDIEGEGMDASQFLPANSGMKCTEPVCHYILLDDLSSTGNQIEEFAPPRAASKSCVVHITPALLVATPSALKDHRGNQRTRWVPASIVELPPREDQPLSSKDSFGHNNQAALFSFPYMSPDNNAVLGAKVLAGLFTPLSAAKGSEYLKLFVDVQIGDFETKFQTLWQLVKDRKNDAVLFSVKGRKDDFSYPLVWL
eukprot:gnl/Spiro4/10271_TR5463_c0_g1_i1.p1 gnl/Spiro4/10271_TR5463_c0_g1~~gnl/Spiro4/10271_TR5463_c0_g1_i1.p1  ORF type:complete len:641 (+),score=120.63 gnl/Spiro4/10271_TR5463_c0_g1_i1:57-1925(+)